MQLDKTARITASILITLAVLTDESHGSDEPGKALIDRYGLIRAKTYLIVSEEEPFRQKVYNMRSVMSDVDSAFRNWNSIIRNESEFHLLTDRRVVLIAECNEMRMQIAKMPSRTAIQKFEKEKAAQFLRTKEFDLRRVNTQVVLCQKRLVSEKTREKAESDFRRSREKFLKSAAEARELYDEAMTKYKGFAQNSDLMQAIRDYGRTVKVSYKLGPSEELRKDAGRIMKFEKAYSPETAPRR